MRELTHAGFQNFKSTELQVRNKSVHLCVRRIDDRWRN